MGIAGDGVDARTASAVAATHVVGFRAALGERPLVADQQALDPDTEVRELVADLATRAVAHRDAHLAKYTPACLDAAADDLSHRDLYLGAAARLGRGGTGGRRTICSPEELNFGPPRPTGNSVTMERRHHDDGSGRVTCRVCFARVELSLDRVDDTPMYVYHRCPACEQWFTIRRADLDRLRQSETDSEAAAG